MQLQYKSTDSWTDCFKVTADDGKGPIKMPNTAYLGFSAHTGELSDNFDIISVDTKNMYQPSAGQSGRGPQGAGAGIGGSSRGKSASSAVRTPKKQGGGWGWFLFKCVIVILGVGGAYVGYTAYRTKQRKQYRGF